MKFCFVSMLCFSLLACHDTETTKIERTDEPDIYQVREDDPGMNEAIRVANVTFGNFDAAFKSGNPAFDKFSLKQSFATSNGHEHIWIGDLFLRNDTYYGVVNNLPGASTEVKLGDTIQIATDKISDWMYFEGRKLRGGYTVRLLRDRMSEAEKKAFDQETGMIIE